MAVEQAVPVQGYREDLVAAGIVIQTEDLWKTYEMGVERLHALRESRSKFVSESTLRSWVPRALENPR